METNNWRPNQPGGDPPVDAGDWRAQLQPASRPKIVNKIMETLKRHIPSSGPEGMNELRKIADRFEEKVYSTASNQNDYLKKISLKMLNMEKSQNAPPNPLPPGASVNPKNPPDPAAQVHNQAQSVLISLPANQAPIRQQMMPQSIQNNFNIQSSASLAPSVPPVSGLPQSTIPSLVGQNSNIQNISNISQNHSIGGSMGQGIPSTNMFTDSQRHMQQGRQQVLPQQQQKQAQNPNYLYQQQMEKQLLQQKLRHGNLAPSLMQQHQQILLQPSQLQSSQQTLSSVMQTPLIQSAPSSGLPQNQQPVIRQQHQSQQFASVHQQHMPVTQQMAIPSQQQQQTGQQMSGTNMQQNQLIGKQNNGEIQQQQQPNRLLGQLNNFPSFQQQQQQQVTPQQNNLLNIHHQQLGTHSHSANLPHQSKVSLHQQTQQPGSSLLATQGQQQSQQQQAIQQQMMMQQVQVQVQSQQPVQMQQQGLQRPVNPLQRDMQQRLQAPAPSLQPQPLADQQKQLYQPQRALPETSMNSTVQTENTGGGDWQEEIYQKIKALKEMYLPELSDIHQRLAAKVQQHDSLPQQPKSEQLDKLRAYKIMLERIIAFISVPMSSISDIHRNKLSTYEKHILHFINNQRPRRPMQQGQQLPPSQMHPLLQTTQAQVIQVQSHDNNQANPQLQPMNMQSSVPTNRHNSPLPASGVPTSQPSMLSSLQPVSNVDSGQENSMTSSQKVALASLQQNPVSTSQQVQPNMNPVQSHSGIVQQEHMKQRQEQHQHILQNQQLKQQLQHCQLQQQLHQQAKQQVQMPNLHNQKNDMNDLRMRQGMNIKPGLLQRSFSPLQQYKPGGSQFSISSPRTSQAISPQIPQQSPQQIPQHSSLHLDRQNLQPAVTKSGTPSQTANSPFDPSPITPLAASPVPGDTEKPGFSTSSLLNAANIGLPQTTGVQAPSQSVSIAVKSASPLSELPDQDDACGNSHETVSAKSVVNEQPMERLIKAVKSVSSQSLAASVNDIGSVVSMMDRIAGSAPGEGSRAAVGEDLVAMTNCRLQGRNFISHGGTNGTRKMKRYTNATSSDVASPGGSISDSFKQMTSPESEVVSTASSRVKRLKIEPNHALLEEIKEINKRLIDTVVDISDEDVDPSVAAFAGAEEGTIIKCSFSAVALSPSLKAQYTSAQMSPIQPLRLLVPVNYPNCSPILLDKCPVEVSKEYEDLSVKAKSRFSRSLRMLQEPMSLKDIARTWDVCARDVISEYAEQSGGGTFSSKFGAWENCLSAA